MPRRLERVNQAGARATVLAGALVALAGCDGLDVDMQAPRLLRASHAPGVERGLSVRPTLRFEFSEALDPDSVHSGALALVAWEIDGDMCDAFGACEEGLCVAGRCAQDPLSAGLRGDLADGEASAGLPIEIALEHGPSGPRSVIVVTPRRALAPRQAYALFVGLGVRDVAGNPLGRVRSPNDATQPLGTDPVPELEAEPLHEETPLRLDFTSARRGSAGPEPELVWPPPGARLVPTNLAFVDTAFVNAVYPSPHARLPLEGERFAGQGEGAVTQWLHSPAPCPGWVSGRCTRWQLSDELAPATRYRLGVGEFEDAWGREALLPADSAWFELGPGPDLRPPGLLIETVVRPPCTVVRAYVDERVRASFSAADGAGMQVQGEGWLELALPNPAQVSSGELRLVDAANLASQRAIELGIGDPSRDLVISEVLVNAEGTESQGEFVELARRADAPTGVRAYSDLWIADESWPQIKEALEAGESVGDPLPEFALAPGGVALIVADAFDTQGLPANAQVIQIGASIGSSGIKNDGEPLSLYDAARAELWSSYSATETAVDHAAASHEGRSAVRRDLGACDVNASWISEPSGGASPGRVP